METRYIQGLENVPADAAGCVLTIGNFDGVHLGHQRILADARKKAERYGGKVVAMTFEPSPAAVLRPDAIPLRISVMHRRVERLLECGADYVVVAHATRDLLTMSAEDFVQKIIVDKFAPRHMIEGTDFFYAAKRSGNVHTLAESGKLHGFDVHVVDPYTIEFDGELHVVSSTLIRNLIAEGRVERASECMGVDFVLAGEVVHGFGRGRVLDYPTANVRSEGQIKPADGVYAGIAIVEGLRFAAAINVGYQPTFEENAYAVEAFLVDKSGEFYGRQIWVDFVARLRDQIKFESPKQLQQQITKDVEKVNEIVGKMI